MTLGTIVGLMVIGFMLLFFELFLPGGIIGSVGAVLIGVAVYGTFQTYGPTWGLPVTFFAAFGIIGFIVWWAKYFPESKIGSIFNLRAEISRESGYVSQNVAESELLGKPGITVTPLRPSGEAEIEGQRIDVISEGGFIDKGMPIEVIAVDSNRILVALSEGQEPGQEKKGTVSTT